MEGPGVPGRGGAADPGAAGDWPGLGSVTGLGWWRAPRAAPDSWKINAPPGGRGGAGW